MSRKTGTPFLPIDTWAEPADITAGDTFQVGVQLADGKSAGSDIALRLTVSGSVQGAFGTAPPVANARIPLGQKAINSGQTLAFTTRPSDQNGTITITVTALDSQTQYVLTVTIGVTATPPPGHPSR